MYLKVIVKGVNKKYSETPNINETLIVISKST